MPEGIGVSRAASAAGLGLGALLLIYLLSGVSGLVYQVLWQRMLALTFGVSAYATATVLAAFMAGLALGGYLAGRVADRVGRPLVWYGVVEVLIGLTGLLTPWAFIALQDAYAALYAALGGSALAPVARFAMAFSVLLETTAGGRLACSTPSTRSGPSSGRWWPGSSSSGSSGSRCRSPSRRDSTSRRA
jgi:MFS family permease